MASAVCTSFKQELLGATHDLDTDVIKLALYSSAASLSAATTAYSATNEVTGTGYSAGGYTVSGGTLGTSSTTAYVDFTDVTSSSTTVTFRYGLLYNSSKSNKAIGVLDFSSDQTVTAGTLTIQWPAPGTTAILTIV